MAKITLPLQLGYTDEIRNRMESLLTEILDELQKGDNKYSPHAGPKRGFGVLRAELQELKTELDAEDYRPEAVHQEAVQVAAMAIKFLRDCSPKFKPIQSDQPELPFHMRNITDGPLTCTEIGRGEHYTKWELR